MDEDDMDDQRWIVFLGKNMSRLCESLDVNLELLVMLYSNSVISNYQRELLSYRTSYHRSTELIKLLKMCPNKLRTVINILEKTCQYRAADILKEFETTKDGLPNPPQELIEAQIYTGSQLTHTTATKVREAVLTIETLPFELTTFRKHYAKVGTGITSRFSYRDHSLLPKHLTENSAMVWVCKASYDKLEQVENTNYVRTPFNVDFDIKIHKYEGRVVDYFKKQASKIESVSFIGNFEFEEILDSLRHLQPCIKIVHFIDVRIKLGTMHSLKDQLPGLSLTSFAVSLFGDDVNFQMHKPDKIISPLLQLTLKKDTVIEPFLEIQNSDCRSFSITIDGNTVFSFDVNDGLVVLASKSSDDALQKIRSAGSSLKRVSVLGQKQYTTPWGAWNFPSLEYLNLNTCPLRKIVAESSYKNDNSFLVQFPKLKTLILDSCSFKLDLNELKSEAISKLEHIVICNDFVAVPEKKEDFMSLCSQKGSKIVLINCRITNSPDYLPDCSNVPRLVEYSHGDQEICCREFFWSYYPFWDTNQMNSSSKTKDWDSKYYFEAMNAKNFSWYFQPGLSDTQLNEGIQRFDSIRNVSSGAVQPVKVNEKVYYFENEKQLLWQGKFGSVYKGFVAEDGLNVEAAVKVIPIGSVAKKTLKGENCPQNLGHTNILKYYGRTDDARSHYIAFELCHMPLDVWLEKCQGNDMMPIEVSKRLDILRQITKGVAYLQKMRKVHRNLNPGSILIKRENKQDFAKISHWGSCKDLYSTSAAAYNSKEHAYVAPELMCMKIDVYSLGQIFYYVLSDGQSPEDKFSTTWSWDYWGVLEVIKTMTDYNPETRMSAEELLKKYPIFWYLKADNFNPFLDTFGEDGANGKANLTGIKVEAKEEKMKTKSWQECMQNTYKDSYDLPKTMRGYGNYSSDTLAFFRAVRNCRVHAKDHVKGESKFAKLYYREGDPVPFDPQEFFRVWFEPFPSLFYPVWKAINITTAAQSPCSSGP